MSADASLRQKKWEELARRLTLIWVSDHSCEVRIARDEFRFVVDIAPDLRFTCYNDQCPATGVLDSYHKLHLTQTLGVGYQELTGWCEIDDISALLMRGSHFEVQSFSASSAGLRWDSSDGTVSAELQEFIAQWLPLFRRNTFLLGCPLECSAHERLEWNLWWQEQQNDSR